MDIQTLEVGINRRQGFNYVLSPEIQNMIFENRNLVKTLSNCTPTTLKEREHTLKQLQRYQIINHQLKKELPHNWIAKLEPSTSPHIRPLKSMLMSEYMKCLKFLDSFAPNSQSKEAIEVYHEYNELRKKLSNLMDISDLPTLTINPRGGNNDNERRTNRLKIITLTECNSCNVCGFPFTKMLDVHHVKPLYLGGTNEVNNFAGVCCNCHRTIHRAISNGHISQDVKDYYGVDPEMLNRLETIVDAGMENTNKYHAKR